MYKCKYCGAERASEWSLSRHIVYCKENPNGKTIHSKGSVWVSNAEKNRQIKRSELEVYLNNGWVLGINDLYKHNLIVSIDNNPNVGRASTPEAEKLRKERISETMKKNPLAGGYRKGAGRGHKGRYKGLYCDSSWELAFLVYYKEHNLYIERCTDKREYEYDGKIHTYLPDFITDEGIIEIKGYKSKQWEAKYISNPDIKVLYKDDMQPYLNYVIEKYGVDFWKILYD